MPRILRLVIACFIREAGSPSNRSKRDARDCLEKGCKVKRIGFVAMATVAGFCSGAAQAQTLFEVEHARGNYRAGLVSEYDAELIRIWGAPSGHYPGARYLNERPSQARALRQKRDRAKRRAAD